MPRLLYGGHDDCVVGGEGMHYNTGGGGGADWFKGGETLWREYRLC